MNTPVTDIFTITFWRDAAWLELLCYSVQKYATGFRSHIVLIPRRDESICRPIVERYGATPVIVNEYGNGNLFQCAAKSHAYLYSDAEAILFLDSDCWLTCPTTPESFMQYGKPLLLFTPYAVINAGLKEGDNFTPWQQGTENAIGYTVENEYMRRGGQMHIATLLRDAMQRLETQHKKKSWDYIMECPPTWLPNGASPGYSEFNYLGAVAHSIWWERYACLNTVSDEIPDTPINQGWSHKHPTQSHKRDEIERELKINVNDLFGIKILPCNIAVPIVDSHLGKWTEEQGKIDTDPTVRERVCPLIPAGSTVIDGGAAIGDWTLPLADACGPDGTVIAYEPNLVQFRCLAHNVAGRKGIVCNNSALGCVKGFCEVIENENMGASHIVEAGNGHIRIDVIDDLELSRCDAIKLDVEGYELLALRGAINTIKRCNPILIVEMNRGAMERVGLVYADMFEFLDSIGYSYAPLCPESATLETDQYDLMAQSDLQKHSPRTMEACLQC